MNQKHVRDRAGELVGVPFLHSGRNKAGIDCLGLAWLFYKFNGIDIPDTDNGSYLFDWMERDRDRFLRFILSLGQGAFGDLQPLDLVYFRFGGFVSHVGVMVDASHFLHIMRDSRSTITPLSGTWCKRFAGARRISQ